jgi:hypothetical protein
MPDPLFQLMNSRAPLALIGWEDPPPTPGEPPYVTGLCLVTGQQFEPRESLSLRQIAALVPLFCPFCNSMHDPCAYILAPRMGLLKCDFVKPLEREVTAN